MGLLNVKKTRCLLTVLRQLTKSLLERDFGIKLDLPDDRLCPPVSVTYPNPILRLLGDWVSRFPTGSSLPSPSCDNIILTWVKGSIMFYGFKICSTLPATATLIAIMPSGRSLGSTCKVHIPWIGWMFGLRLIFQEELEQAASTLCLVVPRGQSGDLPSLVGTIPCDIKILLNFYYWKHRYRWEEFGLC